MNMDFLQPGGALTTRLFASLLAQDEHGYPELKVGDRVEAFEILDIVGRGGSGIVYRAKRFEKDFDQIVALKIVRSTPDLQTAFRYERKILASLEHPGICRLIDGGESDDGYIWFAMEFVDGITLSSHLTQNKVEWRTRLRFLIEVSAALDYAHRRLIVHGDIKSSNIMLDGQGRIRLLDFGIATHLNASSNSLVSRAITPGIASPEQLSSKPITTQTDIYQFGILIELLFVDRERGDADVNPPSAVRYVIECLVKQLKTAEGGLIQMSDVLADLNRLNTFSTPKSFKLPAVGRLHLSLYKFRRFIPVTVILIVVLFYGAYEYLKLLEHRRELSELDNRRLNAASQLLVHMLSDFNYRKGNSKQFSIGDVLDDAAKNGLLALGENSSSQLALRNLIAQAYVESNLAGKARDLLAGVVNESDSYQIIGKSVDDVYFSKAIYARALIKQGFYDEAKKIVHSALSSFATAYFLLRPLHEMRFSVLDAEIAYFTSSATEAEKVLKIQYIKYRDSDYANSEEFVDLLLTFDTVASKLDRPKEGIGYLRMARDITVRRTSPGSVKSLHLSNALVWRLLTLAMRENDKLYSQQLENEVEEYEQVTKAVYGSVSIQHAKALEAGARAKFAQGQYESAKESFEAVVKIYELEPDLDPGFFGSALHNYASSLAISGKFDEAIPIYEKALKIRLKILPEVSDQVVTNKMDLSLCLCYTRKVEQSMSLFLAALRDSRRYFGPNNWRVALQILDQAECMKEMGQDDLSSRIVTSEVNQEMLENIPEAQRSKSIERWLKLK